MGSSTVFFLILSATLTIAGISSAKVEVARQVDLTAGLTPIVVVDGDINDNPNNGVIPIHLTPPPTPSPTPTVTIRTLTSNVRTPFTFISTNADTKQLGNYVVNFVTFRQRGADGPLEVTDYRVTVLGGQPFTERIWDKSNSQVSVGKSTNSVVFYVHVSESACNSELSFTGEAEPRGPPGAETLPGAETPPLSEWASLTTVIVIHKTWCDEGLFFQRSVINGADLQLV